MDAHVRAYNGGTPMAVPPASPTPSAPAEIAARRRSLLRPALHAGTGLLALALGVLPPAGRIAGAVAGVVAGWIVLPRLALERRLRRPGERFVGGLRTYPVGVLLLVVLLPPAQAAAAWGVLAFGDAAASVVGRRVRCAPLFGHPKATWAGSGALVAVGALGAWAMAAGVDALGSVSGIETGPAVGPLACLGAAVAAGLADLIPVSDDNLPQAAAAGGAIAWLQSLS
jgi:hypothetical protein